MYLLADMQAIMGLWLMYYNNNNNVTPVARNSN
jgi:hypothetical protein